MILPAKRFAFRRRLIGALAVNKSLPLKTKILCGVAIFAIAFAVRSLHAVDLAPVMYTDEQPFGGLTETYDRRAASIIEGEGLLGPYTIDPADTKWLSQAPGYSIFLSGVYSVFGRDFFKAQTFQNLVNSLSPVLIFLIAGTLLGWRVGVASGLLAALSHHLAHISNFILPDAMTALPILAAVYLLIIARRSRYSYLLYALAGLMIGCASWLRAQPMLLGLFLALLLALFSARRVATIKRAGVMAIISLLAIAPITIRNYSVYGEFVPIQTGTGLNLWEGIADASGDRFGAVKTDGEVALQEAEMYNDPRYAGSWTTPDGIKRDRDRVKRSLDVILDHPFWYAGVMLGRCGEMLKYSAHAPLVFRATESETPKTAGSIRRAWREIATSESSIAFAESLSFLRPFVRAVQRAAKETLLLFIIVGAVILFIASRKRAFFISMIPLYYFVFQSMMHTEFRYTLPMQYFMFVFAAVVWVLIGAGAWKVIKALMNKMKREEKSQAAA